MRNKYMHKTAVTLLTLLAISTNELSAQEALVKAALKAAAAYRIHNEVEKREQKSNSTDSVKPPTVLQQVQQYADAHQSEIKTAEAVALAVGTAVVVSKIQQPSSQQNGKYSDVEVNSTVDSGRVFSQAQKEAILNANRERNGGVLRSDLSGKALEPAQQHTLGYSPPANEAQVDHIVPRSAGGMNSMDNAQVLSRQENLIKSDH